MSDEIFNGTVTTTMIAEMEAGDVLKINSSLHDIASTRMSEVNKASRIINKAEPKRWTMFSRTKDLGYISITRIR